MSSPVPKENATVPMSNTGAGRDNGDGGGAIHVMMFPWLAFGHISAFVMLARKLVAGGEGGVRITFLTATTTVTRVEDLLGAPAAGAVTIVPLHLPPILGLPAGAESTHEVSAGGQELLKVALDDTQPQVAALLAELRPDAVIFDFAMPWVCDAAKPLGIKPIYYSTFAAAAFAYITIPARRLHGPCVSVEDLMSAPDGFPLDSSLATVPRHQAADFTFAFTSFHGKPCIFDRVMAGLEGCAGFVIKTCPEMERPYIDYISSQLGKPVLLAGPVVSEPPRDELEEGLAGWLSSFPDDTVVYASFGSETFLSVAAARELLLGLEATNRPFLVVLNFPKGPDSEAELRARIPAGFEERVKGRGMVHTGWVRQQHILRHRSVGCFVTHVGMSSVVEGLVAGCRLVLLPMRGDMFLNAALFARELDVGVEVRRRDEDGWFGSEDVSDAVAAAVAEGGEREAKKWREFLMDEAVQKRYTDQFITKLKDLVKA